jgi:serine/threonine-protein kinase RsbT
VPGFLLGALLYAAAFRLLFPVFGAATGSFEAVPVVVAALLWGVRGGVLAALVLGMLDGLLLYPLAGIPTRDFIARGAPIGVALTVGTGAVVGRMSDLKRRLRDELAERHRAEAELRAARDGLEERVRERTAELEASELRRRTFVREVLLCVTEGVLYLCAAPDDLPAPLPRDSESVELSVETLGAFRSAVRAAGAGAGFPADRLGELLLGAGETAMNAVVHGGGGTGRVGVSPDGAVLQVWVEDRGGGIDPDHLHRATLEKGFTTAGSLGQGFGIVLQTADRVWLLTGPAGTTLVLEKDRRAPCGS